MNILFITWTSPQGLWKFPEPAYLPSFLVHAKKP
jgi:hypothetical protein